MDVWVFNYVKVECSNLQKRNQKPCVSWSKVAIWGMAISPLIGNPYNGYINPYYKVDDHPLLYGKQWEFRPQHMY